MSTGSAEWYDTLPTIEAVKVFLVDHERTIHFDEAAATRESIHPDRIFVHAEVRGANQPTDLIILTTDVALFPSPDADRDASAIRAAVTTGTTTTTDDFAELLGSAFFTHDEWTDRSYARQRDDYREAAFERAAAVMLNTADAARAVIERTIRDDLRMLIPDDMELTVRADRMLVHEVALTPRVGGATPS